MAIGPWHPQPDEEHLYGVRTGPELHDGHKQPFHNARESDLEPA